MLSIALSAAALLLPFWAPQPARADLVKAREDSTVRLPGGTVPYGTPRTEASWMSLSPDTFVSTGVVSLLVLFSGKMNNTKFGAHPKECDYISYLRYRHSAGPSNHTDPDRILSLMPGTLARRLEFRPSGA